MDSLLLFAPFSSPNLPNLFVPLLIHLAIVNVSIISVLANLTKNYFKPLHCRDKHSIIKTDELFGKHNTVAPLLKSLSLHIPMIYCTVQGKETLMVYK